jgi:hypothetical protein
MIIEINDKLVSTEVFDRKFICDLKQCKGACCVEGDAGAPVTQEEIEEIRTSLDGIKEFMRPEGRAAIEHAGISYKDDFYDDVITLVDGGACAFAYFDDNGTALCAIEKAYQEGKSSLKKPLSCHLYPIRISKNKLFQMVNYQEWHICGAACVLGESVGMPVYKFLKDALIRAFGERFYKDLEEAEKLWREQNKQE